MGNISLRVNGRDYSGWKTARVARSMEAISGSFELGISERWQNQNAVWPIGEGDACEVLIGGTPVITGSIDARRLSYSTSEHTVSVSGRDRAGDLIDCSAFTGQWDYSGGVSVLKFAQYLCKPYGIGVSLAAGVKPHYSPAKFSISPGDTVFNVLEHACRLSGVLPVSDGKGNIVLTRASTSKCSTSLVEGKNILKAEAEFDFSGRFRKYVVYGQRPTNDEDFGLGAVAARGTAEDPNVTRAERTLIVQAENASTWADVKNRAQWEATVRAARSESITVTVQGWLQGGVLWPINSLVEVDSPSVSVFKRSMLIVSTLFSLSVEEGALTQLVLRRPDSFLPEPIVSKDNLWREIPPHGV